MQQKRLEYNTSQLFWKINFTLVSLEIPAKKSSSVTYSQHTEN